MLARNRGGRGSAKAELVNDAIWPGITILIEIIAPPGSKGLERVRWPSSSNTDEADPTYSGRSDGKVMNAATSVGQIER